MNDELQTRLHAAFRSGSLPAAPAALVRALEETPNAPLLSSRRRPGPWPRVLALAAVLLVGSAVAVAVGNRGPNLLPVPSPQASPVGSPAAEPSAGAPLQLVYEPQWTADVPYDIDDLAALVGIVQQRIDATGVVGALVATDDQRRLVVDLPAGTDPEPIRRLVGQIGHVGFVPLGDTIVEPGMYLDPASFPDLLDGIVVPEASVVDDQAGNPSLQLTLGEPGAELFADYTAGHIGSAFAITLDGIVIASPVINSAIPDGELLITFDSQDPPDLAMLATIIRIGPLPVALVEVSDGPAQRASAGSGSGGQVGCPPACLSSGPIEETRAR